MSDVPVVASDPYTEPLGDPRSPRFALDPVTGVLHALGERQEGEHFVPAPPWTFEYMMRDSGEIIMLPTGEAPRQHACRARYLAQFPDMKPFTYSGERYEWVHDRDNTRTYAPVEDRLMVAWLTTKYGEPTRRLPSTKGWKPLAGPRPKASA